MWRKRIKGVKEDGAREIRGETDMGIERALRDGKRGGAERDTQTWRERQM